VAVRPRRCRPAHAADVARRALGSGGARLSAGAGGSRRSRRTGLEFAITLPILTMLPKASSYVNVIYIHGAARPRANRGSGTVKGRAHHRSEAARLLVQQRGPTGPRPTARPTCLSLRRSTSWENRPGSH